MDDSHVQGKLGEGAAGNELKLTRPPPSPCRSQEPDFLDLDDTDPATGDADDGANTRSSIGQSIVDGPIGKIQWDTDALALRRSQTTNEPRDPTRPPSRPNQLSINPRSSRKLPRLRRTPPRHPLLGPNPRPPSLSPRPSIRRCLRLRCQTGSRPHHPRTWLRLVWRRVHRAKTVCRPRRPTGTVCRHRRSSRPLVRSPIRSRPLPRADATTSSTTSRESRRGRPSSTSWTTSRERRTGQRTASVRRVRTVANTTTPPRKGETTSCLMSRREREKRPRSCTDMVSRLSATLARTERRTG